MSTLKTSTYYVFGNEEFAFQTSHYFVLYGAFIDQENLSPLFDISNDWCLHLTLSPIKPIILECKQELGNISSRNFIDLSRSLV